MSSLCTKEGQQPTAQAEGASLSTSADQTWLRMSQKTRASAQLNLVGHKPRPYSQDCHNAQSQPRKSCAFPAAWNGHGAPAVAHASFCVQTP